MAELETSKLSEAFSMNGGDGPNNYAKNSTLQRGVVDATKELLIENILEAVEFKYQSQGLNSQILEFQVFFNDHTPNDFNMLFKSLQQNRRYYAAGVPGSFYGRLFSYASIQMVHSSYATHWLSRVPKEVADRNTPAWNKGRIYYSNSTDEVVRAYEAQYAEDMEYVEINAHLC
ncbi:putative S-adenosylmethionine-dependent methyltransferase [Prunus yedoensis var. nudiflora]|uniref:Putative S-adenosylmethionine-dependent methyltransferase n=1 Tax=Prunus yedoensis var. nudiflora TaxID=2094558 RepID=A0A314ZBT8_PRUYE|nr:putative S-adenosylmethionine-dependent methyltransferase [Prunus yedoensis var. nudiflora]